MPYTYYSPYVYPITDQSAYPDFQACCLASGYSQEACIAPGVACPVAINAVVSGGGDEASANLASYCCPLAYQQWGYGFGGPYY